MHSEALRLMSKYLDKISWAKANVLDVGSLDKHERYRRLITERGWNYTGLDIKIGPNVNVVTEQLYSYPFPDNSFDIVISGSTMEHIEAIWLWIPELVRLLRPAGFLVVVAPHRWAEHKYPVDCWRILPDGMKYLFDMTGQLESCIFEKDRFDTVGAGFKKCLT